jgi:hypothetical protein
LETYNYEIRKKTFLRDKEQKIKNAKAKLVG